MFPRLTLIPPTRRLRLRRKQRNSQPTGADATVPLTRAGAAAAGAAASAELEPARPDIGFVPPVGRADEKEEAGEPMLCGRVTKLVSRWCGGFTASPSKVVSRTTEDAKPVDGTTATNPVNCLSSGGGGSVWVSSDRELALPSSGVRSGASRLLEWVPACMRADAAESAVCSQIWPMQKPRDHSRSCDGT